MPLDITFTLSDQDLEHFQGIVDKAKTAMEGGESNASIEAAARALISDAKSTELSSSRGALVSMTANGSASGWTTATPCQCANRRSMRRRIQRIKRGKWPILSVPYTIRGGSPLGRIHKR